MAREKTKIAVVIGIAILLSIGGLVEVVKLRQHSPPRQNGRLKLPTGGVNPMVGYGYSYFGVVLAPDGSLWSWGEERLGWPVLGFKNIRNSVALRRIGNENDWTSISVGGDNTLAIKSDGTLWAWGANYRYQLGDGTKTTRQTPVRSVPGTGWKQAASGGINSLALKNNGTLWGWGANWAGQLGVGSPKSITNAVQVGLATNWTKIWAGGNQTAGLQSDGSLWFWGTLDGDGKDQNQLRVPTRVSPDTNWVDVCFGYFTVFAIKSDGTLWSWGRESRFYTLKSNEGSLAVPMQVGSERDWQSCASMAGGFYQLLKKKDGTLWAMDASEHREVKAESQYKPVAFRKINLNKDVVAFSSGSDDLGVVVTREGEVWTWGKVLGEHSPKDFTDAKGESIRPEYRVITKPWQLSIVDPKK